MSVVSGNLTIGANFQQTPSGLPVPPGQSASPGYTVPVSGSVKLANGTGADNGDLKYTATLTFATGTPQVLDLKSLLDIYGGAVAFARIRTITLKMRAPTDGETLSLGYATTTTNAWVSLVSNPGQIFLQAYPTSTNDCVFVIAAPGTTGYVVGASNKLLNLDPGTFTGAFTVDIEIVGVSA